MRRVWGGQASQYASAEAERVVPPASPPQTEQRSTTQQTDQAGQSHRRSVIAVAWSVSTCVLRAHLLAENEMVGACPEVHIWAVRYTSAAVCFAWGNANCRPTAAQAELAARGKQLR